MNKSITTINDSKRQKVKGKIAPRHRRGWGRLKFPFIGLRGLLLLSFLFSFFSSCYKVSLRDTQFQVKMAMVLKEGTAYSSPPYAFAGDTVRISAIANNGYHFKEWKVITQGFTLDNATITANPASFVMPAKALLIQGVFEANSVVQTYTLAVNNLTAQPASTFGTVAITTGSATGNVEGASVEVKAIAKNGYAFVKWVATDDATATAVSTANPYSFNIVDNTTLYAIFIELGSSVEYPIEISTAAELATMASGLDKHYKLTADITVSSWTPVGIDYNNPFTGSLDGNGHTVTITSISGASDYFGLFGVINVSSLVKNLMIDATLTASGVNKAVGGVAGTNRGTIEQCAVIVHFQNMGSHTTGGIAGYNYGTIKNCYTTGDIAISNTGITDFQNVMAGGIAGSNQSFFSLGIIENCYATGNISITDIRTSGSNRAGGIVGRVSNSGQINNCVALGSSVQASNNSSTNEAGRIVGELGSGSTLAGNYGLATMTVTQGGSAKTLDVGGDKVDGADITDANSKLQATYTALGWDFTNVWKMDSRVSPYPILRALNY